MLGFLMSQVHCLTYPAYVRITLDAGDFFPPMFEQEELQRRKVKLDNVAQKSTRWKRYNSGERNDYPRLPTDTIPA
jgi:hypothetical protein